MWSSYHARNGYALESDIIHIEYKEVKMTQTVESNVKLNLEGLLCPIPVVKVSQAVKGMNIGDVLEATATDPGVMADIPAWTKSTGNELISMEKDGKLIRFLIKRTK
jgi:tRNA 2-thiouridine synthesizing protein A